MFFSVGRFVVFLPGFLFLTGGFVGYSLLRRIFSGVTGFNSLQKIINNTIFLCRGWGCRWLFVAGCSVGLQN